MIEQQDPRSSDPLPDEGNISTADLAGKSPPEAQSREPHSESALSSSGDAAQEQAIDPSSDREARTETTEPLFPANDAQQLQERWNSIQAGFVDEPRTAVESADSLVATAMKRLAETFANERAQLETQWDRGDDVSTEDLRVALQRYRSFFGRLLSM